MSDTSPALTSGTAQRGFLVILAENNEEDLPKWDQIPLEFAFPFVLKYVSIFSTILCLKSQHLHCFLWVNILLKILLNCGLLISDHFSHLLTQLWIQVLFYKCALKLEWSADFIMHTRCCFSYQWRAGTGPGLGQILLGHRWDFTLAVNHWHFTVWCVITVFVSLFVFFLVLSVCSPFVCFFFFFLCVFCGLFLFGFFFPFVYFCFSSLAALTGNSMQARDSHPITCEMLMSTKP